MADGNSYPIILAHGIARFDFLLNFFNRSFDALGLNIGIQNDALHYFRGIASHLRANGFDVSQSSVSFAAGGERRAADLRDEVNKGLNIKGRE
ncbi:MAG: hypothetical protein ACRD8U_03180, partial [Pyrinomonadaceae bacterium]